MSMRRLVTFCADAVAACYYATSLDISTIRSLIKLRRREREARVLCEWIMMNPVVKNLVFRRVAMTEMNRRPGLVIYYDDRLGQMWEWMLQSRPLDFMVEYFDGFQFEGPNMKERLLAEAGRKVRNIAIKGEACKQRPGTNVIRFLRWSRWLFGKTGREQIELCSEDLKRDRRGMLDERRRPFYIRLCLSLSAARCFIAIFWGQIFRALQIIGFIWRR